MVDFISYDRMQAFLLPPDLHDWIGDDDLVHFIKAAVEGVDIGAFKVNWRGHGKAQYHPRMMLALLINCYANGIFSSRRIERATHRDVAVRFIAADTHPDHDTIATFRRENLEAFAIAFHQVLLLARELGLPRLGMVSIDGSQIDVNASKVKSTRYDRAQALPSSLAADIAAPTADAAADHQSDLTDPDSKLMRKSTRHEFRQAYNAQAVVDAEGSQLVLATNVAQTPRDGPTFEETIVQLCETVGQPETILGDAGFANDDAVATLEARGIEVLVAVSRSDNQRPYDFRPPNPDAEPPPEPKAEWRIAMKEKFNTEDAKAEYKRRKCTVEPVFGIIKNFLGFNRLSLTGIDKVKTEWLLVFLAHNCKRLCNLKIA